MGSPVAAQRLGSYEIIGKLARGGMAELFLAKTRGPENFEKVVVLKRILPSYAGNPKFVKLFLDEARLAAGLEHPHIAHVYDMGTVEGNYFFAMEYVHGKDVRSTMRRITAGEKQFPIEHAVLIARSVAEALHYAHERRRSDGSLLDIVHRDVSPSNILISYDGAVKLVDFGVAKAASSTVKTRTGTLKGKISYMSPEQAKGAAVDRRSDVFSLGIVLWEMVTGNRLFRAENDLATIQMIINSTAQSPRELRPECPEELERVIMKALAVDADARYQTAEALQLDLEELARDSKLAQSSMRLRDFMQKAFEAEIAAWKEAQEQGHTLTDFVASQQSQGPEMTTPVSESELEYVPEELDEEDDDEGDDPGATRPLQPPRMGTIQPRDVVRAAALTPPPSVVVGRVDHTPVPEFPRAPKEWLPEQEPVEPVIEPVMRHWRNVKLGAIAIGVLILVVAVVCSGGGGSTDKPAVVDDAAAQHTAPMTVTVPVDAPPPVVIDAAVEIPVDAGEVVIESGRTPASSAAEGQRGLIDAPKVHHNAPAVQNPIKRDPKRPKKPFDPNSPLPPP